MTDFNEKTQQSKKSENVNDLPPETHDEAKEGGDALHPPDRRDMALKRFENLKEKPEESHEHSLQENAKERAKHPESLNAGTPYDWEDLEAYQKELDRLDKNPPKGPVTP